MKKSRRTCIVVQAESRDRNQDHEEEKVSSIKYIHVWRDGMKPNEVKSLGQTFLEGVIFQFGIGIHIHIHIIAGLEKVRRVEIENENNLSLPPTPTGESHGIQSNESNLSGRSTLVKRTNETEKIEKTRSSDSSVIDQSIYPICPFSRLVSRIAWLTITRVCLENVSRPRLESVNQRIQLAVSRTASEWNERWRSLLDR